MNERSDEIPDIKGRDIGLEPGKYIRVNTEADDTKEIRQAFSRFVDSTLVKLNLPRTFLCERFDVSVDIVEHWRSGKGVPHPVVRQDIIEYLHSVIESHSQTDTGPGETPRIIGRIATSDVETVIESED